MLITKMASQTNTVRIVSASKQKANQIQIQIQIQKLKLNKEGEKAGSLSAALVSWILLIKFLLKNIENKCSSGIVTFVTFEM